MISVLGTAGVFVIRSVFLSPRRAPESEATAEEAEQRYQKEISEKDALISEQKTNLEWLQTALDTAEERNRILAKEGASLSWARPEAIQSQLYWARSLWSPVLTGIE